MDPHCPNGHAFTFQNIDAGRPPVAPLGVAVRAVYCRLCGHVYGVVRVGENE